MSVLAGGEGAWSALSNVLLMSCSYYPPSDVPVSVVVERNTVANPSITGMIYPHPGKYTGRCVEECVYASCTGNGIENYIWAAPAMTARF